MAMLTFTPCLTASSMQAFPPGSAVAMVISFCSTMVLVASPRMTNWSLSAARPGPARTATAAAASNPTWNFMAGSSRNDARFPGIPAQFARSHGRLQLRIPNFIKRLEFRAKMIVSADPGGTKRRLEMDNRRYRAAMIGFFAVVGLAIGGGGPAAAQPAYTLRYGVDTEGNINALAQRIAERQGFFVHEGINLQPVRFVATG